MVVQWNFGVQFFEVVVGKVEQIESVGSVGIEDFFVVVFIVVDGFGCVVLE